MNVKMIPSAEPTLQNLGGKGWALAQLKDFPVPEFLVVPPCAFLQSTHEEQRVAALETDSDIWFEILLSPELAKILIAALPEGRSFAVRSSATDEDGEGSSFAGQFESFLNISREEVPRFVSRVWASGFSKRNRQYRASRGIREAPTVPAVLVQQMIEADYSGVCFSRDPLGSDGVVIAAVEGLGDQLVSGEAEGEHIFFHDGKVTGAQILPERFALKIAALAKQCETFFGKPQDIEWAVRGNDLFLLQSRAITTLAMLETAEEKGEEVWWDNSNIVESYSGVTTPLTFSFASRSYRQVYRVLVKMFGVSQNVIDKNAHVFDTMIGLVRGRVYYNLTHWYKVLAMLPGFSVNRKFMEQMMGVSEGMPDGLKVDSNRSRLEDLLHLVRTVFGLIKSFNRLPKMEKAFYARLEGSLTQFEYKTATPKELMSRFRSLEQALLNRWDAPLVNDFFCMVFFGLLSNFCKKWLGPEAESVQNDLVAGRGGIISAEPAIRLEHMAQIVRSDFELQQQMKNDPLEGVIKHATLGKEFDSYLQKFGDRCLEELKLESPTLIDHPETLARMIAQLSASPKTEHPVNVLTAAAEALIATRLSGFRRIVFAFVLKHARAKIIGRENLRFERTRVFGEARRIFREVGKRFALQGRLANEIDIFYLTVEEILSFVEGTSSTQDLSALSQLRKKEFADFSKEHDPPRRFSSTANVYDKIFGTPEVFDESGESRSGLACSPGIVLGKVRVVLNPNDTALQEPAILVAERTDPGWITILPMALGLIVERGSLLSHSAIVARELGIPCVVGVVGATKWLKDGEQVDLNGKTGTIRKVALNVAAQ